MKETTQQTKEREHQEDLQRLKGLRPIDDDFMRCIFKENIPLTQHVLQIITQKTDLTITSVVTQADMKRLVGARSICLDAYGTDSTGKKYDLEVQRADNGAGVHRARYHVGVIDVENLDGGQKFSELPDVYVIFITEHDIFGEGKAFYPIERVNMATGKLFDDGEHILYVNGAYRGNDEIGRLMHDFSCNDPDKMYNKDIADITRYYKETQKGVDIMCKAMDEMKDKKEKETKLHDIRSIMETLDLTAEQAMDALKISEEERKIFRTQL